MAVSESYMQYVSEQLDLIEGIYNKKMFGGVGFFVDGKIFACIMGGVLRLKTDEYTKGKFIEHGMAAYKVPNKAMTMPYYEVPQHILENKELLKEWSFEALEISKKKK